MEPDTTVLDAGRISDVDRIQNICSTLTRQVADGRPGIDPEDFKWIRDQKDFYQRELEKEEIGLISRQDAFINYELLDSLEACFEYLENTNPKKAADRERQGSEHARLGAKANIEVLDFFIKIHQEFGLKNQEVLDIFYQLFEKDGLAKEFIVKGLRNFPAGCLAAVVSYLYLKQNNPDWEYKVPTVEQDVNHSIDLVAVSENTTHYITVKGGSDKQKVFVKNITDEKAVEALTKQVQQKPNRGTDSQLGAIYKIHDFVEKENEYARKSEAHYLEVPTR